MKKAVILYAVSVITISIFGMFKPSYYLSLLINTGSSYSVLRILAAIALLANAFYPKTRSYLARYITQAGGLVFLFLGAATLFSPNFFDRIEGYTALGDTVILIEGGVLAMLLGFEMPAQKARILAPSLHYIESLLAVQPKKLLGITGRRTKNLFTTFSRAQPHPWRGDQPATAPHRSNSLRLLRLNQLLTSPMLLLTVRKKIVNRF